MSVKSEEEMDKTLEECFNEISSNQVNEGIEELSNSLKNLNSAVENSEIENDELIEEEEVIELTFTEIVPVITQKYLKILNNIQEVFKDHETLGNSLKNDISYINEKLEINNFYVLNFFTDNYLYCLEQVKDHNSDYFVYQKEKKVNKKGKSIKNKISKLGPKTYLKNVLSNLKSKTVNLFFDDIIEIFELLIYEDENVLTFNEEYVQYINENFEDNKNFKKILVVLDNVDQIMSVDEEEEEENEELDKNEVLNNKKSNKKNSKKSKDNSGIEGIGEQFMKGIEDTNIAKLAKNISEKIDIDDYPILTDPTKLISSLTNPSEEGGLSNLLQFVVGEVKGAFNEENMKEDDLVGEAQNIMGNFGNLAGINPADLMNNSNLDLGKFADIFNNMNKK